MDHDAACRTWNVFRRRNDEGLCCAVPADAAVPDFLFSGEWDFGFAVVEGDPPVTGFSPAAAARGAAFNGFHLFLALVHRGSQKVHLPTAPSRCTTLDPGGPTDADG